MSSLLLWKPVEGSHTPCVSSAGNSKRRREEDEGEGVEEESVNSDEHQPVFDQPSDHKEPLWSVSNRDPGRSGTPAVVPVKSRSCGPKHGRRTGSEISTR